MSDLTSPIRQPIYLRCELKPHERRSALTPTTAKKLIDAGFDVTVERDPQRIFDDEEFANVGCTLAPHNTWDKAPLDVPILGLKELPFPGPDLPHTHISFAHCYKRQAGWTGVLKRFKNGGGKLYDLEFLENAQGRRVAAFGWHAGYVGSALGAFALAQQVLEPTKRLGKMSAYPNDNALIEDVKKVVAEAEAKKGRPFTALVIGAKGRCGNGAVTFFERIGFKPENIVQWDIAETSAKPGPYQEIIDADIFVNCIYLTSKIPPFINKETIDTAGASRKLSVVVDVSCDTTNPNNPIPIYNINTTFDEPTVDVPVTAGLPPLTVVSIDHLPTLLPREASEAFSNDLLPSLLQLPIVTGVAEKNGRDVTGLDVDGQEKGAVWKKAERLFKQKLEEAEQAGWQG